MKFEVHHSKFKVHPTKFEVHPIKFKIQIFSQSFPIDQQYKAHNLHDWIGVNKSEPLDGFVFKVGRQSTTSGIMMWPEIYTHDFADGEKVAIILLDTQGAFGLQTTVHDTTTIFALSSLLSSVQCFNLFNDVKEDDLMHLQLFTSYAHLAAKHKQLRPFQQLVFVIRDWADPDLYYGWNSRFVNETLTQTSEQTDEMCNLRQRIRTSYDGIRAFLLPHPGQAVAKARNFTGRIQDIEPEFVKHVNVLVPDLLAPEKLVVKSINGEKVKVQDFIRYAQSYVNLFNSDQLPELQSLFDVSIFFLNCLELFE